jgi:hypothetical protein
MSTFPRAKLIIAVLSAATAALATAPAPGPPRLRSRPFKLPSARREAPPSSLVTTWLEALGQQFAIAHPLIAPTVSPDTMLRRMSTKIATACLKA